MSTEAFTRATPIDVSAEDLRAWHFRPGAFGRLTPPWENASLVVDPGGITDGAQATIEVGIGPVKQRWVAEHRLTYDGFVDRQVEGPFAHWEHYHRFEAIDEGRSRLVDEIHYRLPFGLLGGAFGGPMVADKLDRMFRYRHAVTREDLQRRRDHPPPRALDVLVTGATGLIGRALEAYLTTQGHRVHRVTRSPQRPGDIAWNPAEQSIELPADLPIDAVIHLAGENVAAGSWSPARREEILESRRLGTRLIANALAEREQPPAVLVSASGSGYYRADGAEHDESGPRGDHFLSEVCEVWEAEAEPARDAGIRVVHPRIGAVLTPAGGALGKLLPVFRAGGGGPVGSGAQHFSWIAMDDVVDVLHRALFEEAWEGPINLTAPQLVTNREFARTLGAVLHRPAAVSVPPAALETVFGEMVRETILADLAVVPHALERHGYRFRLPNLAAALYHLLGREPPETADLPDPPTPATPS